VGSDGALYVAVSSPQAWRNAILAASQNDVNAINAMFSQTRTAPTIYDNRVTNLQGGYIKVGNLVFVSVFFQASYTTSGYATYLSGFPVPGPARVALAAQGMGSNPPHLQASIESNGYLRLYGMVGSNESISLSGVYYTTA
jgi:hypothetical protein